MLNSLKQQAMLWLIAFHCNVQNGCIIKSMQVQIVA